MMSSFLTRGLVMMFGYTYPAYECFKTVEKNKPEIEQLRFWCQYWIIVALLTIFERIGDGFVSWLPMYGEAKLAFFVYLWHPKTKGASYVYETFLRPYVARHETEIDRNLLELRARAGDVAALYWQKAASYGQTRFFEVLQYFASQSSNIRPVQPAPQQANTSYFRPAQGAVADRQPVAEQPQQMQQPSLRKAVSATTQQQGLLQAQQPPQRQSGSAVNQPQEPQQAPPRQARKSPQRRPVREMIRSNLQPSSLPQTEVPAPQPQPPSASTKEGQSQTASSGKSISGAQEPPNPKAVPPSVPDNAGKAPAAAAVAAEAAPAVASGDESAPVTEDDVVMEDAIRITRARLRRTRTGKQIGV